jgi:hypothetical protein
MSSEFLEKEHEIMDLAQFVDENELEWLVM